MTKIVHIEIVTDTDIISGDFEMPAYYDESTLTAEDLRSDSCIRCVG